MVMLRWVLFRGMMFCGFLLIDSAELLGIAGLRLRVVSVSRRVLLDEFFGFAEIFIAVD